MSSAAVGSGLRDAVDPMSAMASTPSGDCAEGGGVGAGDRREMGGFSSSSYGRGLISRFGSSSGRGEVGQEEDEEEEEEGDDDDLDDDDFYDRPRMFTEPIEIGTTTRLLHEVTLKPERDDTTLFVPQRQRYQLQQPRLSRYTSDEHILGRDGDSLQSRHPWFGALLMPSSEAGLKQNPLVQQEKLRAPQQAPPSSPSSSSLAVKLLISNSMAGTLIGKGGHTIQEIQNQSGALVRVSSSGVYLPGTQDRVVLIYGDHSPVKIATSIVLHTVHRSRDMDVDGPSVELGAERATLEVSQKLLIPAAAGGLVIGRGGANIRTITETSGARVSLSQKQDFIASERPVTLQGILGSVIIAMNMLLDKLAEEPTISRYADIGINYNRSPAVPASLNSTSSVTSSSSSCDGKQAPPCVGSPLVMQPLMASAGETHSNSVAAAIAGASATATISVAIPESMVGAILGKGGSTISELQSLSGAKIAISQRGEFVPGTNDRTVTITGSPVAAQTAQYLISKRIEASTSHLS